MIIATIKIGRGRRYEIVSCRDNKVNGLEERLRKMLEEHCRARAVKGINVLSFFVVRDRDGAVVKVWSLEVHDSLYGPVVYLDHPWNM
jgi:hypothetical protein